jgi:hypothetical protein
LENKYPNILKPSHSSYYPPIKIEQTESFETSAYNIQTLRNYPEESIQQVSSGFCTAFKINKDWVTKEDDFVTFVVAKQCVFCQVATEISVIN